MSQSKQETQKAKLSIFQSIVTGSVAGATEVLVNHPLWSMKTRAQQGLPFTLNPVILYRGIWANAASMMPITAMQVGLNQALQTTFFKNVKELSLEQKAGCAFFAGVGSALISCPTEMVMTYQGKKKISFQTAYKSLVAQAGIKCVFNGFVATALREGPFAAFFLAGTPYIKSKIQPYCEKDKVASVLAGICSGIGATVVTHGVDTVKTVQQASDVLQPMSIKEAVNSTYASKGTYGFFKGVIPRGTRIVSAVTLMSMVNESMEQHFLKK